MSSVFVSLNQSITEEDKKFLVNAAARLDKKQSDMIMVIEEDEGNFSLPEKGNNNLSRSVTEFDQVLLPKQDRTVKVAAARKEDSYSSSKSKQATKSSKWKLSNQIMETSRATNGSNMQQM
mmetsp:Transcript_6576/g.10578  ORF Transcript_6576/g.10578 Transcript_6576/m.10578 type:complete len:121 (-) Transcript_6576:1047-1409(-)